jgi:hypothetical protein
MEHPGFKNTLGGSDAYCDRKVKGGTFLLQVCRGKIDRDLLQGEIETYILQGRTHPVTAFLYRSVGQSDHREMGKTPRGYVDFHLDSVCINTDHTGAEYRRKHHVNYIFCRDFMQGFVLERLE